MVSFSQQFDPLGRRTQLAAAIGAIADFATDYIYDNLGRIDSIKQHDQTSGNAVAEKYIDFAFDSAGRPNFVTRYADLVGDDLVARSDYTFDNAGRITDLTHSESATIFADYDLTYDAANRITAFNFTSLDGDSGNADYTHDNTNQLTAADYDFQTDETYTYDANGNRTQGGYTTASNNQLLTDSTYTYAYDAEGNRTHRFIDADSSGTITPIDTQVTEYEWDHRNRLIKITNRATANGAATQIVEYAYDQNNRWIRKTLDTDGNGTINTNTIFIYDANQITLHFETPTPNPATTADLTHRYLWGPTIDQLLADETVTFGAPEDVLYPLTDHLNTIRDLAQYDELLDQTTIATHRTYNAFGQITTQTNPTIPHLFAYTARPFDPDTNLQNNLHRWYDANTGRWLSEDPIGFAANDANLFRYVGNSPIMFNDSFGLWKVSRQGKARAKVTSENGDTIKSLAAIIGFKTSDYGRWITWSGEREISGKGKISVKKITVTDKWCAGETIEVPNTMLVAWFGDVGGSIGKMYADWVEDKSDLGKLGFKVVVFDNNKYKPTADGKDKSETAFGSQMKRLVDQKELHGLFVIGHGGLKGFGSNGPVYFTLSIKSIKSWRINRGAKGPNAWILYNDILTKVLSKKYRNIY